MNDKALDERTQFVSEAVKQARGTDVCGDCISDEFLKGLVRKNSSKHECNFCGARSDSEKIAAPLEMLIGKIAILLDKRTVRLKVVDPKPPRSGGWSSSDDPESIAEVLRGYKWTTNEGLASYVAEALECASGCNRWSDLSDDEVVSNGQLLDWSWLHFASVVERKSRFNFLSAPSSLIEGAVCMGELLGQIGELVKEERLLRTLQSGEKVYRARVRLSKADWDPNDKEEMGAPPHEKAGAGRMNPAGIPHFYAAFDEGTALREVAPAKHRKAIKFVLATFEVRKELLVLDLSDVAVPRSDFDDESEPLNDLMYFLANFARDITLPVSKDGSEHIAYVPTQIVSEYFSQVFEPNRPGSARLDGVIYRSAASPGGKNLVLFPALHSTWEGRRKFRSVELVDWRITKWPAMSD